ncbi:AraC family transcriptional regulator [Sinanaerobacter sp. ZZT-01]|uniref:AraC family transcriptional regulator n=1 Tax=Sinanaerobacter sp. ZZT-01 TaxID=3111540 RepID=UPI002D789DF8|nr:AraC family transcriptional regulator [Sinanaerobacter sp. ZZT-01]WRR94727.1 AraC family transcriptional regulator [Sinanaerobacter sp. ZZT-01]
MQYTSTGGNLDAEQKVIEKAKNVAKAFSNVTQIPVTFFYRENEMNWEWQPQGKLCNVFTDQCHCSESCLRTLNSAASTAHKLREAYIFVCNSGMIQVAYPVIYKKENCGCVFAGPFAMGSNRERVLRHILKRVVQKEAYEYKLIAFFSVIKMYSPKEVQYLYDLFQYSMLGALQMEREFGAVAVSENKKRGISIETERERIYPSELEDQLLEAVRRGNAEKAQVLFSDFFEKIKALEADNLGFVKIRLMELTGILSRVSSKNAVHTLNSYTYLECLDELNSAMTFQSVFGLIYNLIGRFANDAFLHMYEGNSETIRMGLRFIEENYKDDITLNDVAEFVHINPSYLSTLFKQEMGIAFTYYLTELRIDKSLRLLADTSFSLTEIALRVGFNSQSYFIKVFKSIMGMTPKEYRKKSNTHGSY